VAHGEESLILPKQQLDGLIVGHHADEQVHITGLFRRVGDFHAIALQSLGTAAGPVEADHAESRLCETPRHRLPHASQT